MRKTRLVLPVLLMILLAADIAIATVKQEVSILSFVCVALIAMLQTGCNLLCEYYDWKNGKQ